jgi:4a-hydroxytetrahydrobiopterin dehydratase
MTAASAHSALAAQHCKPGAPRLSAAELGAHLPALPGWKLEGNALTKTFRFPGYGETIAFVNAVAVVAQREDHHPDLSVHYDRCTVTWSTHSAGGVTMNDVVCAAQIDDLQP